MAWGEVLCTYRGSTDSALISLGISKFRNLLEAYKLNTCFKGVITVITISLQSVNLLLLNAVFLPSDAQATFLFFCCVSSCCFHLRVATIQGWHLVVASNCMTTIQVECLIEEIQ